MLEVLFASTLVKLLFRAVLLFPVAVLFGVFGWFGQAKRHADTSDDGSELKRPEDDA